MRTSASSSPAMVQAPAIALPKGGGAIRGIGETFAANPVTGTASLSIPIPASPGRSGFGPALALRYDSGAGNGPFGLGWSLDLPAITRRTDRGIPRYDDANESDVFQLAGQDDLVPARWADGTLIEDTTSVAGTTIRRYRPRVESSFTRIERWTVRATGEVHWRTTTGDNVTTVYGAASESRVLDPSDDPLRPTRIFLWLPAESFDDRGNALRFVWVAEDSRGVSATAAHEANRTPTQRAANRYLKRILYGNTVPRLDAARFAASNAWLFELVLDYGDHDDVAPLPAPSRDWGMRNDPFSSNRAGFEVRTYRLCRRVLMFHHFPGEPDVGADCLVRSLELRYHSARGIATDAVLGEPRASLLVSATAVGYRRAGATMVRREMPPLELEYSLPQIDDRVRTMDRESLENLPTGIDDEHYRWLDLYGEGIAGVLTEQGDAWLYKRNLSPIAERDERGKPSVALAPATQVATRPNVSLRDGAQIVDLAGDGAPDLVLLDGPSPGFFEVGDGETWTAFTPFASQPTIPLRGANTRFVDLDGDGRTDVLVTEDRVFTWFPSRGEVGFGEPARVPKQLDEERGPTIVFDDGTEQIHLADMTGDGLSDIVRVRSGEVCYWPNLGYGRFGAKITMDDAPVFDAAGTFHERRVLLADVDGTGCTDLIYVGADGARVWFNESGNSWSAPALVPGLPRLDDFVDVDTVDLFGNGTSCLVWSSAHGSDAQRQLHYVDLMGGTKPYLLVRHANNLGAETRLTYASSAKFFLLDRLAGTPWITKLPFPVQVVERVDTLDRVSGNAFTSRYAYHHGHFDGEEREFRGFGMVEQWDTEELASLADPTRPRPTNIDDASHVPPVHVKRWYHTGVFADRDRVSTYYAGLRHGSDRGEYWREPAWRDDDVEARKRLLEDTVLPTTLLRADGTRVPHVLTSAEEREACRALRGSLLREETFGREKIGAPAERPYNVTEQSFTLELLQAATQTSRAVFLPHARETVSSRYERREDDPRFSHDLVLDVDPFGNVLLAASIAYGRRAADVSIPDATDRAEQTTLRATCAEYRYTAPLPEGRDWRTPLAVESRTYELTGLALLPSEHRLAFDAVRAAVIGAGVLRFDESPSAAAGVQKRMIGHSRTRYRPDDLGAGVNDPQALLPLGTMGALAVPGETLHLALTAQLATSVFGARVTAAMLQDEGRYVHSEGDSDWWAPSGRVYYSPTPGSTAAQELDFARRHFFLPRRYRDPFHTAAQPTEAIATLDAYDLLLQETRDALGNRTTAGERDAGGALTVQGNDYRVLSPRLVMDANRNRAAAAFDALGRVAGTAVMGKPLPAPREGDSLDGFEPDLPEATVIAELSAPSPNPATLLGRATTRVLHDAFAYRRSASLAEPQPVATYALARETHDADTTAANPTRIQRAFSYTDGFGREIQRKIQAEPGPVPARDATGRIVTGADGRPVMSVAPASPRWVGTGWTVFDNKGAAVRRFEPFFTDTHRFERDVRVGVSRVMLYDPLGRLVATLHPDHRWEKIAFDAWREERWDAGDTVAIPNPAADADVGAQFERLPSAEYLPSWHARRIGGAMGPEERDAAEKSEIFAETFTTTHLDALGRSFLTVLHNRTRYADTVGAPPETLQRAHVALDIQGNQREARDAQGRVIARYRHDLLGNCLHQESMEAGARWNLRDAGGDVLYVWDSRDHLMRATYDALRRPTGTRLRDGNGAELLVERVDYGEGQPSPETDNLRGRRLRTFDQAGVLASDQYDFKGNLLRSSRQLAQRYDTTLDWSAAVPLETPVYVTRSWFDAPNRTIQMAAPHALPQTTAHVVRMGFNEAGLLERIDAWIGRAAAPTTLLDVATADLRVATNVDHDARGMRTCIDYGNGTSTTYGYDPLTLRLAMMQTRRGAELLQDLHYVHDAAGNVTRVRDDAQQTIFFRNRRVEPSNDFRYDALSRLLEATGREHLGQPGAAPTPSSYDDVPRVGLSFAAGDGNLMAAYLERYVYDLVGNCTSVKHAGTDPVSPGWIRTMEYAEPSQLEPGKPSNRLTRSFTDPLKPDVLSVAGNGYDAHGNLQRMPQLQEMRWDFLDQLRMTRRQAVNASDADGQAHQGERTWYVYNSLGERVRKVTETSAGSVVKERIYLGGFEIFRRTGANALVRETLQVMEGDRRIALVEVRTAGSEPGVPAQLVRFQHDNHVGSAALELDDQARIVSYEEYSPYGNTTYQAVRNASEAPKRYRFTGRERDEESGLTYHGTRYYAAWLLRWTSCDRSGLIDGMNLYAYARQNPVRWVDPLGRNGTTPKPASGAEPPPPPPPPPSPPGESLADRNRRGNADRDLVARQIESKGHGVKTEVTTKGGRGGSRHDITPDPKASQTIARTLENKSVDLDANSYRTQTGELDMAELQRTVDSHVDQVLKHEQALREGRVADMPQRETLNYTLHNAQEGEAESFQRMARERAGRSNVKVGVFQVNNGTLSTASGKVLGPASTTSPTATPTPEPATPPPEPAKPSTTTTPKPSTPPPDSAPAKGPGGARPMGPGMGPAEAFAITDWIVSKFTGKSLEGTFDDFVRGGLGDPEARLRFGEGLHTNKATRDAAAAAQHKREVDKLVNDAAMREGVSPDEIRKRWADAAKQRANEPRYFDVGR